MARLKKSHLSKTGYVNGLACKKWLWLDFNAPDRLPQPDSSAQFLLDQGRQVGELARSRYPRGELLPPGSPRENDRLSRKLLDKRVPLFEAGFIHPNGLCYARADVLVPMGNGAWDVVEVKSAGSIKEEHLHDLAFQRHCYAAAGLNVRECHILHINTKYERSGEIDLAQLFQEVDISEAVEAAAPTVGSHITELLKVASAKECPEFGRGEPFHDDDAGVHSDDSVWRDHPGSDIQQLYRGGKQALALLESGVFKISDIPESVSLKGNQVIQHAAHTSGQVHVDRDEIAAFLEGLVYPLHFVDFETFGTAIPIFDGARPYQQIPFQFSVHVVMAPGQKPLHHSFLSMKREDPRRRFLESLRTSIGPSGSLVAYNQSFEKKILADLAVSLPEYAEWVDATSRRFVDLMSPFRQFAYYNPAQGGSASLKEVLPAVTGQGYGGFEIANGTDASIAYLRVTFGTHNEWERSSQGVDETRRALERYCGRDTEGMVWIVEKLSEFSRVTT